MAKNNLDLSSVGIDSLFGGAPVGGDNGGDAGGGADGDGRKKNPLDDDDDGDDGAPGDGAGADGGAGDAGDGSAGDGNPGDGSGDSGDGDDSDDGGDDGGGSGDSGEDSLANDILSSLGYDLGEDYTPEDTIEGIVDMTKQVASRMAQEQQDEIFAAFPDVAQYLQYRMNGGDSETFFKTQSPETDYSKMEVTDENISVQKSLVRTYLKEQGFNDEELGEIINDYEDAGILKKHAEKSLGRLQTAQRVKQESLIASQAAAAEAEAKANEEKWNAIQQTINTGTLRGLQVSAREQKAFFEWMATPVDKQGRSQRMIAREEMDDESMLALEYLVYKGLDFTKLVSNNTKTKQAQNLKSRLKVGSSKKSRTKQSNSGQTGPVQGIPDVKDVL